jgi:hypothetical protein
VVDGGRSGQWMMAARAVEGGGGGPTTVARGNGWLQLGAMDDRQHLDLRRGEEKGKRKKKMGGFLNPPIFVG